MYTAMSRLTDEGPVYYREIHKNAFLRRIVTDNQTGKLLPSSQKKPMWTQLCVHNGLVPYLEQYSSPSNTSQHKPTWRASLKTAKYVSASVKPWPGKQYDFLVTTDEGSVRMLAADWDSMQDWVTTLRAKLQELKVISSGENVYCSAPVAPLPRAGFRDPTSPLPPTPVGGPVRVPGIEIITQQPDQNQIESETVNSHPQPQTSETAPIDNCQIRPIDNIDPDERINWDQALQSLPSTSTSEPLSVTKISGQNICLDNSILKRNSENLSDSDDDIFYSENSDAEFKQRVVICDEKPSTCIAVTEPSANENEGEYSGTNITVINVSNKAPHTAIPILNQDTNVFQFDIKQPENSNQSEQNFVNIVNTEVNINNDNTTTYNSEFSNINNSDYGHISLTTTLKLPQITDAYEKLYMASTSKTMVNKNDERKTSLPNLPNKENNESPYEFLFPLQLNNQATVNSDQVNRITNQENKINNQENRINDQENRINDQENRFNNQENRFNSQENRFNHETINNNQENRNHNKDITITNNSIQNSVQSSGILGFNVKNLRSNIERSHSQNSYDSVRLRDMVLRNRNMNCPRRNNNPVTTEQKPLETNTKPIWKRGLTELNLLSKIRNISITKNKDSNNSENATESESSTSVKVVQRSRGETRVDSPRRRSSSLNNGTIPNSQPKLKSLRQRQAAMLRAEQHNGAAIVARIHRSDPPIFADASGCVWIAKWNKSGSLCTGRTGDRVSAILTTRVFDSKRANALIRSVHTHMIDILFQRVPHGKIYVLTKETENQSIGIKIDNECQIVSVEPNSPADLAGIPPPGQKWCVTEVNNQQINIVKGGEEEMTRLSSFGKEVSIIIQPATLVKKLRAAIKSNRTLLNIR